MAKPQPPRVVIFAGPNGAGKSTHADAIVAALGIDTFVNADYIARGLSGRHADAVAMQAGRIMLTRLKSWRVPSKTLPLSPRCPAAALRLFCASSRRRGIKWRLTISR